MSEFKPLDPTACGLFLVAAISLPLAISCFDSKYAVPAELFLLVGAAVFASGYGIGIIGNLVFGIIFVMCIIWSILAKTPKNLTLILCTTAAIFLVIAIQGIADVDLSTVLGIVALLNFAFNFYMASALASEGKFPVF